MATFIVHLGKSNKRFKLQANSCDEIALLVAAEMPDEWYGMSIQKETLPGEPPTFMCNACKEYYDEIADGKTPLEIATQHMLQRTLSLQQNLAFWAWDPAERDEVRRYHSLKYGLENKLIKEID